VAVVVGSATVFFLLVWRADLTAVSQDGERRFVAVFGISDLRGLGILLAGVVRLWRALALSDCRTLRLS
jgi:hypothetical protein